MSNMHSSVQNFPSTTSKFPEDCAPAQHVRTKPLQEIISATTTKATHNQHGAPKPPNHRDKAMYPLNAHSKLDGIIQWFTENKCDPRDSSTLLWRKKTVEDRSPYIS